MQALLHSVLLTLQQATTNPRPCQRLLDTHGQVWVSLVWGHCSFLLGLGVHSFVPALQESVSPVLCKFWWLYGGVNGDLLQEGLCHTQVYSTQSPRPCAGRWWPVPPQETLKHSKVGLAQSLWGLLVYTKFCLSPPSISAGDGVWF